ncbi:MAG: MerR family transcriptional regulator [Acidimicrobiia bacterium]|nr:MerR family transcriptional regulator [Acidimicrobiia bacterium]
MTEITTPPVQAPAEAQGQTGLRIDDLAHRAGLTVDTIRYYQREGLLPPGERCGRTNIYGREHLERLERIKALQGRRFSLAAIRALLAERHESLVDGIFADVGGRAYALDELIERSGIDPDLVEALRVGGLLRDPVEYGRDAYDGDDLDLLRTMTDLHALGLPAQALVELGRIYADGIEATQRQVIELFATGGDLPWSEAELAAFQDDAANAATEILPKARRLVDYLHHRTIQRLTLGAIEHGVDTATSESSSS